MYPQILLRRLIFKAPDNETATAAILHLGAMGNVHTTTSQAFTAVEINKIVAKVQGDGK